MDGKEGEGDTISPPTAEALEVGRNQKLAGRLKGFLNQWKEITCDAKILQTIRGYKIPFISKPVQFKKVKQKIFSNIELKNYTKALQNLLSLGAIKECKPIKGQFLSPYFLRKKPNGDIRFIFNLKELNKFTHCSHFKLEDYRSAQNIIFKNYYMASIDLKDAYFLIPIYPGHRKYLRFLFNGKLYEFSCLPFGLNTAPYTFTKTMKPIIHILRAKGFLSVIYLDDLLLVGKTKEECYRNVNETINLLNTLGFVINYEKSTLKPRQICKYLGFIFNSNKLSISLPADKTLKIIQKINNIKRLEVCKIRKFAQLIGLLISACPTNKYSWLHTKVLEREKITYLRKNFNNYNKIMKLTKNVKDELEWWLKNIQHFEKTFKLHKFDMELFSDASETGWGAFNNKEAIHGFWDQSESREHINYLELKATFNGIKSFAKNFQNCNILLRIDNTTAIAYINKMGGTRYKKLNEISNSLWKWCENKNIWLFASYINSKDNVIADRESRISNIDTEYSLSDKAYEKICSKFGYSEIDLFASSSNKKCQKFVSWKKDPDSFKVDAFTLSWENLQFYAFPPFALIPKIINKIISDNALGILVVPMWQGQTWYPLFEQLLVEEPLILKPNKNLLLSPFRKPHPLWPKLTLVAGKLSGTPFYKEIHQ